MRTRLRIERRRTTGRQAGRVITPIARFGIAHGFTLPECVPKRAKLQRSAVVPSEPVTEENAPPAKIVSMPEANFSLRTAELACACQVELRPPEGKVKDARFSRLLPLTSWNLPPM